MKKFAKIFSIVAVAVIACACGYKVTYNLSGGSIPPAAQTFSVAYFPNNAPMVAPTLSKVNFQNAIDQTMSFNNKTFSSYADYDASQLLIDVQDQLIEEIVEALVNDIYMAAAGNW